MNRVWLVLQKELRELLPQRILLGSISVLPLMVVGMTGYLLARPLAGGLHGLPSSTSDPRLAGMTPQQISQTVNAAGMRLLLLFQPLLIPTVIAAYSVVGEKSNRTLEPLLAAPVRTWQLLLAKGLAALLPTVAVTWISGAIFIAEVSTLSSPAVFAATVTPGWLFVLVLTVPVMVTIPVALTVMISSRVNDPRSASQASTLLFVLILLGFELFGASLVISLPAAILATFLLALLGAILLMGATRVFQREAILTRWS